MDPKWLDFAQRIQAIAQSGLQYDPHLFDRERYEKLTEIATEMIATYSDSDIDTIQAAFRQQDGHATPKVDVRGVVFRDQKILLVRENLDGGRWTVPGGWADINEAPSQATEREVYEETGYRAQARKLIALYDRRLHGHGPHLFHIYKLIFLCDLTSDAPAQAQIDNQSASFVETGESAFFAKDAIPGGFIGRPGDAPPDQALLRASA